MVIYTRLICFVLLTNCGATETHQPSQLNSSKYGRFSPSLSQMSGRLCKRAQERAQATEVEALLKWGAVPEKELLHEMIKKENAEVVEVLLDFRLNALPEIRVNDFESKKIELGLVEYLKDVLHSNGKVKQEKMQQVLKKYIAQFLQRSEQRNKMEIELDRIKFYAREDKINRRLQEVQREENRETVAETQQRLDNMINRWRAELDDGHFILHGQ